jgi:site-specific DNA-cytosine methylase
VPRRKSKQILFADAFAGCGGLSLGLMQAGCKGLLAIEKDEFAFETLKSNLIGRKCKFSFPRDGERASTSLRGAKRRSNPLSPSSWLWIASLRSQ